MLLSIRTFRMLEKPSLAGGFSLSFEGRLLAQTVLKLEDSSIDWGRVTPYEKKRIDNGLELPQTCKYAGELELSLHHVFRFGVFTQSGPLAAIIL